MTNDFTRWPDVACIAITDIELVRLAAAVVGELHYRGIIDLDETAARLIARDWLHACVQLLEQNDPEATVDPEGATPS
jgi:hypothetical protein